MISFVHKLKRNFPEFYEEMRGIADGSKQPLKRIVFWNLSLSFDYMFSNLSDVLKESHNQHLREKPMYAEFLSDSGSSKKSGTKEGGGAQDKCSAFIAVGDYTKDGKIVCAHNSFDSYIVGQYLNVILDLRPNKGHRMLMQSMPGGIYSGTDMFVTSRGIFGTRNHFWWIQCICKQGSSWLPCSTWLCNMGIRLMTMLQ